MNKIIIIVGATASGKSELANKLAIDLNLELINADAFQVYKEISVGINKPSENDLKKIKHHFINSKSIFEEWNIKEFQDEFFNLLNKDKDKNFIMCGGSNLYIDSVIKNYNLPSIKKDLNFNGLSNIELWNKLNELDSEEAQKININNTKRLKQALKIILSLNEKKSLKDKNNLKESFKYLIIWKECERNELYEKINSRVLSMIDNGWKNEIINLIKIYGENKLENINALKAIGYPEIYTSIKTNTQIDVEKIQQKTRQYAKRQLTWIRNKFPINITYDSNYDNYEKILIFCKDFINGK